MGKAESAQSFGNKDAFSRINFLFQAAFRVLNENPQNIGLARYYTQTLKTVAQKSTLRLDPSIKRQICKKCAIILIPGITATVRTRGQKQTRRVVKCLECGQIKRFVLNDSHHLWSECPEGWLEQPPSHLESADGGRSQSASKTT